MPSPIKVTLARQVVEYHRQQHPETRRALKAALAGLASGRGDIKELEDELAGYHRLSVGSLRVIYRVRPDGDIECIFAERRKVVYELFAARLRELLE